MRNLHLVQDLTPDALDARFFRHNSDRMAHIRRAAKNECLAEFRSLGDHDAERRRIVLWRVPTNNPFYDPKRRPLLKIPFLAFADESIEDTDEVLLPVIHTIMSEAK